MTNVDDYTATRTLTVRNQGDTPLTLEARAAQPQGNRHTVGLGASTVTVPAHGEATLDVTLTVPTPFPDPVGEFHGLQVAGLVILTPQAGANAGVALRVPYYLLPVPVSDIDFVLDTRTLVRTGTVTTRLTNPYPLPGYSRWYVWTMQDADEPAYRYNDLRAVGVSEFQGQLLFGIALHKAPSHPGANEYRIYADTDRDGTNDVLITSG